MSVGWESEGEQNLHGILQSHWGQTGIAARISETGVYSWPVLQKEFPHNRGNLKKKCQEFEQEASLGSHKSLNGAYSMKVENQSPEYSM